MSIESSYSTSRLKKWPLVGATALIFVEFLVIGIVFKHGINFTCRANWPIQACSGPSGVLVSIYCLCAALALFAFLFPAPFLCLFSRPGEKSWPLLLNIAGVLLTLAPVTFLVDGSGTASLVPALGLWSLGMAGIIVGILLYLAPFDRWIAFLAAEKWRLIPLLLASVFAPFAATLVRPLWQVDTIASMTFSAVAFTIKFFGYDVEVNPGPRIIGANDFFIDIAPVCSGVEGIALVTIFVTLYMFLFKSELRFPRALLLYPLGIMVSAALNIVRIVSLLAIGLNGNPELAVGGFHSHAGWLMFTLVSLGIIVLANNVEWFRKPALPPQLDVEPAPYIPPFFKDMTVAMILPFAVFMFSALLAQVLSENPGVIYPARAALMACILLVFLPLYRTLDWRLDPIAIGAGVAIGVLWVFIPIADPDTLPPYGNLAGTLLILWFVARGIGTIVLVPVIEELFFRGYLEQRLKRKDTLIWTIGSAIIVAALFALLHSRWIEAFAASLVFSYIMHRSGKVTDAIVAHGVANAIIFAVATATGQIHII